jgi:transposase-like protein
MVSDDCGNGFHRRRRGAVVVTGDDRRTLERWARSRTLPLRVIARARIVLALASGLTVTETVRRLETSPVTVRLWRRRYQELGPAGLLRDRPGRGRKPSVDPTVWADLAHQASIPGGGRALAASLGLSPSTVSRWRRRSTRVAKE